MLRVKSVCRGKHIAIGKEAKDWILRTLGLLLMPSAVEWCLHLWTMSRVIIDYTKNPKQEELFLKVAAQLDPDTDTGLRNFKYGGAIRGGKTFGTGGIFVRLARAFPGSKWHVLRATNTRLHETTIPSFKKLMGNKPMKWSYKSGDTHVKIPCPQGGYGSIYFMAEQYNQDKDFNRFKGLETNGILFEQLEEFQEAGYNIAMSRAGSHYCDPMPPAFTFATFNPTWNWVKQKIYEPAMLGTLPSSYCYIPALPTDNPFVTKDQWNQWELLDEETKNRYIKGSWDFDVKGAFYSGFSEKRNLAKLEWMKDWPVWLSFDFNVDPACCIAFQTDQRNFFHVFKEFRLTGSTMDICRAILEYFDNNLPPVYVVGDANGFNRLQGMRGLINSYQIIMEELVIRQDRIIATHTNPLVNDSRMFVNSLMQTLPEFLIDPGECPYLVQDLKFVEKVLNNKGEVEIKKTGKNIYTNTMNEELTHLGDCMRYGCHVALHGALRIHRS